MSQQAAAYINLEIYEDSVNLLGIAKVTLPDIEFPTVSINGAGMMGTMDVPLIGMVNAMTVTINFLTMTQAAAKLAAPKKHLLDMRVSEEYWDVEQAEADQWADKYVMLTQTKKFSPGTVAPMSAADSSGEYSVYYYAAYREGKQLWEIDKRNMRCIIGGVDYMANVRRALGKS